MIRQWYEPLIFSEWMRRAFSFLNIAVFMLTATVVFSEFRFDWFETLVGGYLESTNDSRPETGAIWEAGKQTANAQEYLNQIINKREDTRQIAHQAASFIDLSSSLLPGEWVTLEKQQFKTLYMALEKSMAVKIMDPVQLVWLLNGSTLDRIFCEGSLEGIKVYFIDSENRVIQQVDLKKEDLVEIENGEKPLAGKLVDMDGFQGRIYSPQNFFNALFELPGDIIPDLIANPKALLRQEGKITGVGIWNEAKNGYIKLGFEFEQAGVKQIVFVKGREWAVWQLSLNIRRNKD
ncbi:hypothetical protein [Desulfobacula sp.]|uniref:hypothetical protein n=1 Tax=Desulfobacula sp. TaxID=2593537 RepID=UPI002627EE6B|nr:hypothetical protein [Desulfobacula sp.]